MGYIFVNAAYYLCFWHFVYMLFDCMLRKVNVSNLLVGNMPYVILLGFLVPEISLVDVFSVKCSSAG